MPVRSINLLFTLNYSHYNHVVDKLLNVPVKVVKIDKLLQQDAVLSQGGRRDAAVNFDMYRILQRHRAVSLPQHAFLVGICPQTAVNYLSKSDTC